MHALSVAEHAMRQEAVAKDERVIPWGWLKACPPCWDATIADAMLHAIGWKSSLAR